MAVPATVILCISMPAPPSGKTPQVAGFVELPCARCIVLLKAPSTGPRPLLALVMMEASSALRPLAVVVVVVATPVIATIGSLSESGKS